MNNQPNDDAFDLWDEWMQNLHLADIAGEGELPRWALSSSLYE